MSDVNFRLEPLRYELTPTPEALRHLAASLSSFRVTHSILYQLTLIQSSTLVVTPNLLRLLNQVVASVDNKLLLIDPYSSESVRSLDPETNDRYDPIEEVRNAAQHSRDKLILGRNYADVSKLREFSNPRLHVVTLDRLPVMNPIPPFYALAKLRDGEIARIEVPLSEYCQSSEQARKFRRNARRSVFELLIRSTDDIQLISAFALTRGTLRQFVEPLAIRLTEAGRERPFCIIGHENRVCHESIKHLQDLYSWIEFKKVNSQLKSRVHDRDIYCGELKISFTNNPEHLQSSHVKLEITFNKVSETERKTLEGICSKATQVEMK